MFVEITMDDSAAPLARSSRRKRSIASHTESWRLPMPDPEENAARVLRPGGVRFQPSGQHSGYRVVSLMVEFFEGGMRFARKRRRSDSHPRGGPRLSPHFEAPFPFRRFSAPESVLPASPRRHVE
jgi:hypothetical protein